MLDAPVADEGIRGALQQFARASQAARPAPGHLWSPVDGLAASDRAAIDALRSLDADPDA